jgi:primosomal protein N' (replication factor Y) (superfamily II helicase)
VNHPYADIVLPLPLDTVFTYLVPRDLEAQVQMGSRVLVPFGRKTLTGVVVAFPEATSVGSLKHIRDVLDPAPLFSPDMVRLTKWVSEYYLTPWGEVLKAAAPQLLTLESEWIVTPDPDGAPRFVKETSDRSPLQKRIVETLLSKGEIPVRKLGKALDAKSLLSTLHSLAEKGAVHLREELESRHVRSKTESVIGLTEAGAELVAADPSRQTLTARQQQILEYIAMRAETGENVIPKTQLLLETKASLSTLRTLSTRGLVHTAQREVIRAQDYEGLESPPSFTLSPSQRSALETISKALDARRFETFLLHGVTGSGKTQVYIESIRRVLEQDRTALVLVPEIALTPQIVRRFRSHFGERVVVLHSQLSAGQRYDAWQLAHRGRARIVIGPRSAVFAPLENLGIIVVDEEQESSYKQYDLHPRYHARDIAVVRASQSHCTVVLGSATPSVESYANAREGKYTLLELPERVDNAVLPTVLIVDMSQDRAARYEQIRKDVAESRRTFPRPYPQRSISLQLERDIRLRLDAREGVILLQNRRGFSHVVECFECGYVEQCDRCAVTLTYHSQKNHLRCHYCGRVKRPPTVCPTCGGADIRFHAFGTQQVHTELEELFPGANILRMDLDTTQRRGAHDRMLQQFARGDADILLGTQMVAKGLDFHRVTLVGVISADTQMLLPDFRSSERTFQLLTQVAGRAGRGSRKGEVVIQTLQPGQYSLRYAVNHDYKGYFEEEMHYRKELSYPPYSRLALVEFRGKEERETERHAKRFADLLQAPALASGIKILGPSDAAIGRVKELFRKHLLLKSPKESDPSGALLRSMLVKTRTSFERSSPAAARALSLSIDIDPQGML